MDKLKTVCGVGTAAHAFGARQVVICIASCGRWMSKGVSVPSLTCVVLGSYLQFFDCFGGRFCGVCGASGDTRNECKKRCQEPLKTIQNEAWKDLKVIKNKTMGRFESVLGSSRL